MAALFWKIDVRARMIKTHDVPVPEELSQARSVGY
jgi:hypothetical protein